MGWADYHLHHFQIGGTLYGEPSPEDRDMSSEDKVKIATLAIDGERAFEYVYDYGDNWRCAIVLEALTPVIAGVTYPRLVDGARRGPPEDVGGPWGYLEFLQAIADPKHERHAELTEWIGEDFGPDDFNIDEINRALARLAPQTTRRKRGKRAKTE
jgi:hypothetical protein